MNDDDHDDEFAGLDRNSIPDARDGLTRKERIVLQVMAETQRERVNRDGTPREGGIPMLMLYGRVVERIDMSQAELMDIVRRLMGRRSL